ncbi:MAG: RNA chaperone Hfq [Pseudomonadota bacterium]|nr:RNA chaperone Hfq [Gammaproteobacteria bacterium]MBU1558213.1 RNA chaperone Hfq [Gammaproteobacteria bacterium]MBU1628901.1 RNA chaperone Hfq [Gammaproteobacteria bacterium]MBU1926952.1 RNA chaperone Hfq [Gammaproteobacteria bacterium]MBU2545780.1 RNA chaperone Hfq [Gammaproteobacteria bacterium]
MNNKNELQDTFFDLMKTNKLPVSVFLKSGIQLKGKIINYDPYIILLKNNSVIQLVYKHSISSVVPMDAPALDQLQKED